MAWLSYQIRRWRRKLRFEHESVIDSFAFLYPNLLVVACLMFIGIIDSKSSFDIIRNSNLFCQRRLQVTFDCLSHLAELSSNLGTYHLSLEANSPIFALANKDWLLLLDSMILEILVVFLPYHSISRLRFLDRCFVPPILVDCVLFSTHLFLILLIAQQYWNPCRILSFPRADVCNVDS